MRNPRGTVYMVAGHSCYRGQITLNGKTYYKYFSGSKRECSRQCQEWQEAMLRKYRPGGGRRHKLGIVPRQVERERRKRTAVPCPPDNNGI